MDDLGVPPIFGNPHIEPHSWGLWRSGPHNCHLAPPSSHLRATIHDHPRPQVGLEIAPVVLRRRHRRHRRRRPAQGRQLTRVPGRSLGLSARWCIFSMEVWNTNQSQSIDGLGAMVLHHLTGKQVQALSLGRLKCQVSIISDPNHDLIVESSCFHTVALGKIIEVPIWLMQKQHQWIINYSYILSHKCCSFVVDQLMPSPRCSPFLAPG